MNNNRIKPLYFSAVALIISILVCIIKRVSPLTAFFRIIAAMICFYILGSCFLRVLTEKGNNTADEEYKLQQAVSKEAGEEEFKELKFKVLNSGKQD